LTLSDLKNRAEKGLSCFGLYDPAGQIGFVAASQEADGLFYLEKLAVLPEFRHRGHGRILVDHVLSFAKKNNGNRISISLIDDSEILKRWYRNYGFRETETKKLPHLPFAVCFMEKKIE
jgi:ribosomal protein S18 acetylase RimI-like enzyme